MERLIVAAIVLVIMSIGFAHAETVRAVEIYEYGAYIAGPRQQVGWTQNGIPKATVDGAELIQRTETIVAKIGLTFGFRYKLSGQEGAPVAVTIVSKIPGPGIFSPNGSVPFTTDEETWPVIVGDETFFLCPFDKPSDLVPGVWTFEVWIEGKKFTEKKFNVILPPIAELVPELTAGE